MKLWFTARPPDSNVYALLATSHCFLIRIIHVFSGIKKEKSSCLFSCILQWRQVTQMLFQTRLGVDSTWLIIFEIPGWIVTNHLFILEEEPIHNSLHWVRFPFNVLPKHQHDRVETASEWESDGRATNSLPWPSAFAVLNLHFLFLGSEGDWTRDD